MGFFVVINLMAVINVPLLAQGYGFSSFAFKKC